MDLRLIISAALLVLAFWGCNADDGDEPEKETDDGGDTGDTDTQSYSVWQDTTSGLYWMDPPVSSGGMSWRDAIDYCDGLVLEGNDDWRLPNLDEFRTLIRGCPQTVTGGECTAGEGTGISQLDLECTGCEKNQGPHPEVGGYFDEALSGLSMDYWSASSDADQEENAWTIFFVEGAITSKKKTYLLQVRCTRGP